MNDDEYPAILIDMPVTIKSYVIKRGDDLCIVINSRLSFEMQRFRYKHEVAHIQRGDIDKPSGADRIEITAHGL